jgi:ankyrin repeat protein
VNDNAYNVTLLLTIQDPPLRNALLNHRWYEDEVDVEWPGDLDLFTDVGDESDKFWTPVGVAVCRGSETVLHILIEAGANISTYNDLAFRAAVYLGNLAMVGLLLDAGAENSEDSLIEPAYNGNDEMVALLIARSNANVHVDNDWPLRLAARKGHDVVVARLIAAEANVRAKDDQALRKAAKNGYDAVVALLIAAKANVRAKDDQALLEAAENGHEAVVALLIEAYSDIDAIKKAELFKKALDLAAENGHEAVVALLIEAYSDIDAIKKAEHFKKALDLAAENGHDAVVARLIAAKANVHGRHGAIFLTKPP